MPILVTLGVLDIGPLYATDVREHHFIPPYPLLGAGAFNRLLWSEYDAEKTAEAVVEWTRLSMMMMMMNDRMMMMITDSRFL